MCSRWSHLSALPSVGYFCQVLEEANSLLMGCRQLLHSRLNLFAAAITEGLTPKNLPKRDLFLTLLKVGKSMAKKPVWAREGLSLPFSLLSLF